MTAPRPAALATAPPVLSAGAEVLADPVAEAIRELATEAAEESAELTAAEADAAAELAPEAAADVAAATEEGIATEMPAAAQIPARAAGTSVGRLGWVSMRRMLGHILAASSAEQREGMQDSRELVREAWPVVHWHVTSVTPQPDEGMAATRQVTFH